MGFGILLFGYFTAFAFELINTYFFADIIGGLVMLYALGKLSEYNGKFKAAAYGDMVFCAVAAFRDGPRSIDSAYALAPPLAEIGRASCRERV